MSENIELEKIKLAFVGYFEEKDLLIEPSLEVSDSDDYAFLYDRFELQVKGYLWGQSGTTQTISYPKDWWQAVKQRWFPGFLLKRWPVEIRVHQIDLKTLYPHFRISLPKQVHVLKYSTHEWDSGRADAY